jgi:uncharacterized lipoprotein YajG
MRKMLQALRGEPAQKRLTMKLLLLFAISIMLDACQSPSRFQAAQDTPVAASPEQAD